MITFNSLNRLINASDGCPIWNFFDSLQYFIKNCKHAINYFYKKYYIIKVIQLFISS